jgi:hypothetical protein
LPALVARTHAGPHHRHAHLVHDRPHVGEVEVDEPVDRDQIRDPANRVEEHLVGQPECVAHGRALPSQRQQALVRDRDHGVHDAVQVFEAPLGVAHPHPALEQEGLGDHPDRQGADLAGRLRDHGRRPRAGAAAQSRRHEHHVRAIEQLEQPVPHLEGRSAALVGIGPAAEAARDVRPELDLVGGEIVVERLGVGVRRHELHAPQFGPDHVVQGVAAAAADADHLDPRPLARDALELQ